MNLKKHKLYDVWDQVPLDYYQQGMATNFLQNLWHSHKINSVLDLIKNHKFENCLDIGCNSGYMVSEIFKKYPKLKFYGVDIYDKAVAYARKKYPKISFKVADATKLPYKDNSFDLITFYETIEHVEDPKKVLKEIKRVLNKKGKLILAMDSGSLLFRIVWFVWENSKGKVWKGAHLHPFTHQELEEVIKSAGFKINKKIFSFLGMEVTFVLTK